MKRGKIEFCRIIFNNFEEHLFIGGLRLEKQQKLRFLLLTSRVCLLKKDTHSYVDV